MKNLKSHFLFDKQLRNGAFLLVVFIVILQAIYFFVDFSPANSGSHNEKEIEEFKSKLDSLNKLKQEQASQKIFPFNPNYISDYKGYQLGMSVEEIDKLHEYRKRKKFVNSKEEFQKVTGVSDSLLETISPYFKFPDWVKKKRDDIKKTSPKYPVTQDIIKDHEVKDINKVSESELIEVLGINEKLAERIVKYRKKLKGFTYDSQLLEVWGISQNDVKEILKFFKVLSKPQIKKININTASFKEVLRLPYIDYNLCKSIFDYKEEVAEIQNIEELKNIQNFPLNKYDRIVLYLLAK